MVKGERDRVGEQSKREKRDLDRERCHGVMEKPGAKEIPKNSQG